MHVERLKHLIKVMQNNAGRELDMNTWFQGDQEFKGHQKIRRVRCGYTACALGTAALNPTFQRQGLYLENGHSEPDNMAEVYYRNVDGIEAGAQFFGIQNTSAIYLFDPWYYRETLDGPAAAEVINRLQILLTLGEASLGYYIECYRQAAV